MYSLLAGFWDWLTRKEELRFLIVGIDNAGKTSILERLKSLLWAKPHPSGVPPPLGRRIVPTIGLNLARVDFDRRTTALFWDLGGQIMLRSIWENHFVEADGIIFVVDSCDSSRIAEVRESLCNVLTHPIVQHRSLPLLLLANKQDGHKTENGEVLGAPEPWQLGPLSEALGLLNALQSESVAKFFYNDPCVASHTGFAPVMPLPPPPSQPPPAHSRLLEAPPCQSECRMIPRQGGGDSAAAAQLSEEQLSDELDRSGHNTEPCAGSKLRRSPPPNLSLLSNSSTHHHPSLTGDDSQVQQDSLWRRQRTSLAASGDNSYSLDNTAAANQQHSRCHPGGTTSPLLLSSDISPPSAADFDAATKNLGALTPGPVCRVSVESDNWALASEAPPRPSDTWIPRLPLAATRLVVAMAECSALTGVNVRQAVEILVVQAKRRREFVQQLQNGA